MNNLESKSKGASEVEKLTIHLEIAGLSPLVLAAIEHLQTFAQGAPWALPHVPAGQGGCPRGRLV